MMGKELDADMNTGDPALELAQEYGEDAEPAGQPAPPEADDQNPGFEADQ